MANLYVAHQNANEQGQLMMNVYNGTSWEAEYQVPGTSGMSSSPSLVVYNNQLYCFYQGYGDSGTLLYNIYDGSGWMGEQTVPNTGMSASPSAVVYNGQLWVFHQGQKNSGDMWYNILDGGNWLGDTQVPNTGMSCSPGAGVFNGDIWVAHQGNGNSGEFWTNIYQSGNWQGDNQLYLNNSNIYKSPCLIQPSGMGNVLALFQTGDYDIAGSGQYVGGFLDFTLSSGNGWQGVPGGGGISMTGSPGAADYGGALWIFLNDGSNNLSYITITDYSAAFMYSLNGNPQQISSNLSASPAATVF